MYNLLTYVHTNKYLFFHCRNSLFLGFSQVHSLQFFCKSTHLRDLEENVSGCFLLNTMYNLRHSTISRVCLVRVNIVSRDTFVFGLSLPYATSTNLQ